MMFPTKLGSPINPTNPFACFSALMGVIQIGKCVSNVLMTGISLAIIMLPQEKASSQ
jgi:hypothetical protein